MNDNTRDTRQRMLDAAETLFADRGFDAVSVRDISEAAGVNVAAVNYHFGGKEFLYHSVLDRVMTAKRDRYMAALQAVQPSADNGLEDLLRSFFRTHFEDTLKSSRGASFIKLLVREVHHGNPERRQLINTVLAPLWAEFQRSLSGFLPELDEAACSWIVGSLHGQLIHFTMRWHRRQQPPDNQPGAGFMQAFFAPSTADVDQYIAQATMHLTCFTAAGIRALCEAVPAGRQPLRKDAL